MKRILWVLRQPLGHTEPVRPLRALGVRHDLDRLDTRGIEAWASRDRGVTSAPATLFGFRHQRIPESYEAGLHSQARPWVIPSCFQLLPLVAWRYHRNLRRELRRRPARGHAPHAQHNYLGFQSWYDWDCIEAASAGLVDYVSDWRLPVRVPDGEPWPRVHAPYDRVYRGRRVRVLPTAWDDCRGGDPDAPLRQLEDCCEREIPCIVALHACNHLHELKGRLVRAARHAGVPILSLGEIAERL